MKVLVAFSGGKDSQACLIWAVKKYGVKNVEAVFCDTVFESQITYSHIKAVTDQLKIKLVTVRSSKYKGMVDMAEKKGRFASTKARFCTEELKSKPFIDYVLTLTESVLVIQGIRADESASRSKMEKQCRYFKYYFEPYGYDKKGKPKQFTYRKKEIVAWCKNYGDDVLRPVFTWTGTEVVNYIKENKQEPNKLYYQGFKRVGCFPCFMCGHNEIKELATRYPERIDEIAQIEESLSSSFFKIDAVPERARTGLDPKSGKSFTTAKDFKKYVLDKNSTLDLFKEEAISCSSYFNLCE